MAADYRIADYLDFLLPLHFEEALEDTIQGQADERALIKEVKLLQTLLKTHQVRRALELVEVAPAGLLPVNRLRTCGLDKVEEIARRSIE